MSLCRTCERVHYTDTEVDLSRAWSDTFIRVCVCVCCVCVRVCVCVCVWCVSKGGSHFKRWFMLMVVELWNSSFGSELADTRRLELARVCVCVCARVRVCACRRGFSELGAPGKYRNGALYFCTHLPRDQPWGCIAYIGQESPLMSYQLKPSFNLSHFNLWLLIDKNI